MFRSRRKSRDGCVDRGQLVRRALMPQLYTSVETQNSTSMVAQMRPALVKYFRRKTGSAVEAEDLTQDVLIRALSHVQWTTPGALEGYVFRIAVNCWRDRGRRLKTRGPTMAFDEANLEAAGVDNPPECVLIEEEELNQLLRALEQLTARTRTVVMLIKFEQMRIASVAQVLGISVSAVNKHLARGLACLAQLRNG
jgi:RNA polymerase sigma-70 factor (ECF subfamily)